MLTGENPPLHHIEKAGVHAKLPYQTEKFSTVLFLESSPGLGKFCFGKFYLRVLYKWLQDSYLLHTMKNEQGEEGARTYD